ncbi:CocE/NonD family hydrolase [Marivita sp. GX14005]|uniref:CocE/NonD family hydrolase n=1 Tax=Marivita sp. GX14005 TaxID=2942276 RepID=UPI0020199F22|nr:CocE/NonD family hydrolase [Marivita sp. GX14005]MCL3883331.1 CocE/NonD family hydrolase [Marivita sp. GX14005]
MLTRMVEMRDGVRLATDIHLPPDAAPGACFPVIVERTPYGRADISGSEVSAERDDPLTRAELAAIMTRRGYAVVMQDVRGRGGSGGVFAKYVNEAEDGVDCMDWILAQNWCDGRICTMGLSYGAHTQLAAAVGGARGIAAMAIDTGGLMDLWRHSLRLGGGFELKQVTWAFRHAAKALRAKGQEAEAEALEQTDIRAAILNGDWRAGGSPLAAAPDYEATLLHMWALGPQDAELCGPATRAAAHFDAFPDVPVLLSGSWFDPYASNMMELGDAIAGQNTAPLRRIMGPWLHGKRSTGMVGAADFGAAATLDEVTGRDWITLRLDWFDHALGRGPMPLAHDLFFEMAPAEPPAWPRMTGTWRECLPEPPRGMPVPLPVQPVDLRFDPASPFPTLGGGVTSGGTLMRGGMFDHSSAEKRLCEMAAVCSGGPLAEPVTLTGRLRIAFDIVAVSPPGPVDVAAVLMLRTSDGALVNVTDGFARMEAGAQSGQLDMLATCIAMPHGAEPVLFLATANFPRLDVARRESYRITLRVTAAEWRD